MGSPCWPLSIATASLMCISLLGACSIASPPTRPAATPRGGEEQPLSAVQREYWALNDRGQCEPIGTHAEFRDDYGCFVGDRLSECRVVDAIVSGDEKVTRKALGLARDALTLNEQQFALDCSEFGFGDEPIVGQSLAFLALAGDASDARTLVALLEAPEPRLPHHDTVIAGVEQVVASVGDQATVDKLVQLLLTKLDRPVPATRIAAERGSSTAVEHCLAVLEKRDETGTARWTCLDYLLTVDASPDLATLVRLLDSDPKRAARLLGRSGEARAVPFLESALANVAVRDRAPLLVALVNLGQTHHWNELARTIEPRHPHRTMVQRRADALREVSLLQDPCHLERVKPSLARTASATEGRAALYYAQSQSALAAFGDEAARARVTSFLASGVPGVRIAGLERIRGGFQDGSGTWFPTVANEHDLAPLLRLKNRANPWKTPLVMDAIFGVNQAVRRSESVALTEPRSTCARPAASLFDPTPPFTGRELTSVEDEERHYELDMPGRVSFKTHNVPLLESSFRIQDGKVNFDKHRFTTSPGQPSVRYTSPRCRRSLSRCFLGVLHAEFVYQDGAEQSVLREFVKTLTELSEGAVKRSRALELDGHPGFEAVVRSPFGKADSRIRIRAYLVGGDLYTLLSIQDWSEDEDELVSHVFDSFQLLP
ncbi:MAG: HEAT repeat domain-containing protein [Nannocystales bacterium]